MGQGYNRRIEDLRNTADPVKEKKAEEYHLPRALREGDTVTVAAINRQGTVIAGPDKNGSYQVQLGNMKMKCAPEELRLPEDAPKPPKKKQPTAVLAPAVPTMSSGRHAPSWISAVWQATRG